jgi:peptide deformylase
MSIKPILTFPDPRLREVSKEVTEFGPEIRKLADDMLETMYHANGIGLAAAQIGELKRVLVIDTRPRDEKGRRYKYDEMSELEAGVQQPLILVNPVLVKGEGKTTFDEGCLSLPSYFETVERFEKVIFKAQDVNGKEFKIETDGLLAICMQHEMDHLEGTLFIDHLSFLKGKRIKDQIKKHGYPVKEDKSDDKEPEKVAVKKSIKQKDM